MTIDEIRERILAEDDVAELLELEEIPDGRFRYLIKTPFETFPKFAIGHVSADYVDVVLEVKCGAEWNARSHWEKSVTLL